MILYNRKDVIKQLCFLSSLIFCKEVQSTPDYPVWELIAADHNEQQSIEQRNWLKILV